MQGMDLKGDVTYAGGRAKGTSTIPTPQGPKTTTFDTTATNVIDDQSLGALVPFMAWTPTAKFPLSVFSGTKGGVTVVTLAVAGTEKLTVPAGTFDAYRVELTGSERPATLWVTTTAPHRVLKQVQAGVPVEFVLAK